MEFCFRSINVLLPPDHEPAWQEAARLVADLIRCEENEAGEYEIVPESHRNAIEKDRA